MWKTINKPKYFTTFSVLQKHSLCKKYFHTGTLDVLAFGKLLIVNKNLRFLESFFKSLKKEYEFSFILGFKTDSQDLLGAITNYSIKSVEVGLEDLESVLKTLQKKGLQKPPKISYKNLNTKSKLEKFLKGEPLPNVRERRTKLLNFTFLRKNKYKKKELMEELDNLKKIKQDFRQEKVISRYLRVLDKLPNEFTQYTFKVKVTSGFYIRSLVRDIGEILNVPTVTTSIKRTAFKLF